MQEIMLKILKNIRNSFLILILLAANVEAKNSKDVSNIKVQKKSISHKQKYSLQLVDSKDGYPVRSGDKSWRFEVREGDCGGAVSYTHLTLPRSTLCRSRWSPYH